METNEIPNEPSDLKLQQSKAHLAELISQRVELLGMGQSALVVTCGLNLHDLPHLMSGADSDISLEQLHEALKTLNLSDSAREIIDLKADVFRPNIAEKMGDEAKPLLGEMIRARRRELNITQAMVAAQMGVTKGLVSQWESGRSRIMATDVEKLAVILKTTSAYLMGEGISFPLNVNGLPADRNDSTKGDLSKFALMAIYDVMTDDQRASLMVAAIRIATGKSPDGP